jgi:hypothetical protein
MNTDIVLNKVRSDALWNELTPEQRGTLEEWLFDERMSYADALEKARTELGFRGSISSVRRFYQRVAQERMFQSLAETAKEVAQIEGAEVSAERVKNAGMKLMAQAFLRTMVETPEKTNEWRGMAKLLLRREAMESRVRLKEAQLQLQREQMAFDRCRWEVNIVRLAVEHSEEFKNYSKAAEAEEYEENARLNKIRRRLFGQDIPDPMPESAEEEKAMKKAKEEKEAKEKRKSP